MDKTIVAQPSTEKFSAAYLERRLAEHKRWQHEQTNLLIEQVLDEAAQVQGRRPHQMSLEIPLQERRLCRGRG